jgi:L-lactate dehydrogenase complex protein LldG
MAESMDPKQFIGNISRALGRSTPRVQAPEAPAVDAALVRRDDDAGAIVDRFAARAEAIGMELRRVDRGGLCEAVVQLLRELKAGRVTMGVSRLDEAGALGQAIDQSGIQRIDWTGQNTMEPHYDVDAGISDVHAALADSGSLVCASDAEHGRGLSLVPPVHIAIVRTTDVQPDMIDYFQTIDAEAPADLPSATAIITGPSKTADIEGVLVTGVHGPGRVIILLYEAG